MCFFFPNLFMRILPSLDYSFRFSQRSCLENVINAANCTIQFLNYNNWYNLIISFCILENLSVVINLKKLILTGQHNWPISKHCWIFIFSLMSCYLGIDACILYLPELWCILLFLILKFINRFLHIFRLLNFFFERKVTTPIDRSVGRCLEMSPMYWSIVTSPNGISSRSETLSNLIAWSFKVDFGIPWRLKAASPFKRMLHTEYLKVAKFSASR